jgi:hypothetical protein
MLQKSEVMYGYTGRLHAQTLIYMQSSLMKFEVADVSCVVAEGQLVQAAFAHLKITADLIHNTAQRNVIAFSSN